MEAKKFCLPISGLAILIMLSGIQTVLARQRLGLASRNQSPATAAYRLSNPRTKIANFRRHLLGYGVSKTGSGINVEASGSVTDAKADVETKSRAGPDATAASTSTGLSAFSKGGNLGFNSQGESATNQGSSSTRGSNLGTFAGFGFGEDSILGGQSQQSTESLINPDAAGTIGSSNIVAEGFKSSLKSKHRLDTGAAKGDGKAASTGFGGFEGIGQDVQGTSKTKSGSIVQRDGSSSNAFRNAFQSTEVDGPNAQTQNRIGGTTTSILGQGQSSGNGQSFTNGAGKWVSTQTGLTQTAASTDGGATSSSGSSGFASGGAKLGSLELGTRQGSTLFNNAGISRGASLGSIRGRGDSFFGRTDGAFTSTSTPDGTGNDSTGKNKFYATNGFGHGTLQTDAEAQRGSGSTQGRAGGSIQGQGQSLEGSQTTSSKALITDTTAAQKSSASGLSRVKNGQVLSDLFGGSKASLGGQSIAGANGRNRLAGQGSNLVTDSSTNTHSSVGVDGSSSGLSSLSKGMAEEGFIRNKIGGSIGATTDGGATSTTANIEGSATGDQAASLANLSTNSEATRTTSGTDSLALNKAVASNGAIKGASQLNSNARRGNNAAQSSGTTGFEAIGESAEASTTAHTRDSVSQDGVVSGSHADTTAAVSKGQLDARTAGRSATSAGSQRGYTAGSGSVWGTGDEVRSRTSTDNLSSFGNGVTTTGGSSTTIADILRGSGSGSSSSKSGVSGVGGSSSSGHGAGTFSGKGDRFQGSSTSSTKSYADENSTGSVANDETWARSVGGSLSINNNAGSCSGVGCNTSY